MLRILLFVAPLVLSIYCTVSAVSARDEDIRHLPKFGWLALILLFPWVGAAAWLIAGRPLPAPRPQVAPQSPTGGLPIDPENDEEFQRQFRARVEEQRRRHQARIERERAQREQAEGERVDQGEASGTPEDEPQS